MMTIMDDGRFRFIITPNQTDINFIIRIHNDITDDEIDALEAIEEIDEEINEHYEAMLNLLSRKERLKSRLSFKID